MTCRSASALAFFLVVLIAAASAGAQPAAMPLCEPWSAEYAGTDATGEQVIALWQFNAGRGDRRRVRAWACGDAARGLDPRRGPVRRVPGVFSRLARRRQAAPSPGAERSGAQPQRRVYDRDVDQAQGATERQVPGLVPVGQEVRGPRRLPVDPRLAGQERQSAVAGQPRVRQRFADVLLAARARSSPAAGGTSHSRTTARASAGSTWTAAPGAAASSPAARASAPAGISCRSATASAVTITAFRASSTRCGSRPACASSAASEIGAGLRPPCVRAHGAGRAAEVGRDQPAARTGGQGQGQRVPARDRRARRSN